jgi:hypothetical protein
MNARTTHHTTAVDLADAWAPQDWTIGTNDDPADESGRKDPDRATWGSLRADDWAFATAG